MNSSEKESILTIALLSAFADGGKNDTERAEFKRVAEGVADEAVSLPALYQKVLLKQVTLDQAVAPLRTPEMRQLAYEMAVCICDADELRHAAENEFLAQLRTQLQLDSGACSAIEKSADALAAEPVNAVPPIPPPVPQAAAADSELDKMILHYSVLNGGLELLPESLATMAIIPLQMKMVYRIGKNYGHELDRGHIKELLATAGVGLTSQVVEGYARKLLGGVLGKVVGGLGKGLGRQVASSGMSFATTWALGQMARQYYGGGRNLSAIELRQLFSSLTEQGRALQANYGDAIRDRARTINLGQLLRQP